MSERHEVAVMALPELQTAYRIGILFMWNIVSLLWLLGRTNAELHHDILNARALHHHFQLRDREFISLRG
jgi:hypothetical protein